MKFSELDCGDLFEFKSMDRVYTGIKIHRRNGLNMVNCVTWCCGTMEEDEPVIFLGKMNQPQTLSTIKGMLSGG